MKYYHVAQWARGQINERLSARHIHKLYSGGPRGPARRRARFERGVEVKPFLGDEASTGLCASVRISKRKSMEVSFYTCAYRRMNRYDIFGFCLCQNMFSMHI